MGRPSDRPRFFPRATRVSTLWIPNVALRPMQGWRLRAAKTRRPVGGVEKLVRFQVDIGWAGSLRVVSESTRRAAGASGHGEGDGGAPATGSRKLRGPLPG